jgi:hypothetical protein
VSDHVRIFAKNSRVEGHFRVTSSLVVHGVKSRIKIFASLTNNAAHLPPPIMDLNVTDGEITASVNHYSTYGDGHSSTFIGHSTAANASIDLAFMSAPVASTLLLNATSMAGNGEARPLRVVLPPTFEGNFSVGTVTSGDVRTKDRGSKHWPDREGREREVNWTTGWRAVEGTARWLTTDSDIDVHGMGLIGLKGEGEVELVV